ncbi:hypothetical protein GCM10018980_76550 [Streptomyces capoamus]|uniref:Uncharacterized protein n=1 Tax=Streptomyces capoamus TaxID=68183 RepID=A0A919F3Z9_9ACTN|nr:hypothetical protein [Streptomyces capoamus]GGW13138.1 hypothetical protein GCM10010501_15480 [Streptomyces libani subsp. rufus]GHG77945.1 hypothetical protein GCM10018980_76550 [Streptomyces capoamus]
MSSHAAEPGQGRALAIVERAYRGAVETQFSDALYCAYLFHIHLGGLDLLLRGPAVTYAVRGATPALRLGGQDLHTVNDPRVNLAVLLDSGVGVWVEEPDLPAHGLSPAALLPDVRTVPAGEITARWSAYRSVFYL